MPTEHPSHNNSEIKRSLSEIYFSAVTRACHLNCTISSRDLDNAKVDMVTNVDTDFGTNALQKDFFVAWQLKATSRQITWENGKCRLPIDVDTYNKYSSTNSGSLYFILLLVLPQEFAKINWVDVTAKQLCLKGCAYWCSLYGAPATNNIDSVTISIYKKNRVTPKSLMSLYKQFALEEKVVSYAD